MPIPEGFVWLDHWMDRGLIHSQEPLHQVRLWGANKWESNCVRTVLIHATMHTQGTIARPWRHDMQLGVAPLGEGGEGVVVVLKTENRWQGRLVFDIPRHRLFQGFRRDWPRMNTLPEWFTVEPGREYTVEGLPGGDQRMTGKELHEGLPVASEPGGELRLKVLLVELD